MNAFAIACAIGSAARLAPGFVLDANGLQGNVKGAGGPLQDPGPVVVGSLFRDSPGTGILTAGADTLIGDHRTNALRGLAGDDWLGGQGATCSGSAA